MKSIQSYFQRDRFAQHIGIEIIAASKGYAKAAMKTGEQHLNAANVVHGGAIFGLADLVFAVASNSHGKVALGINVSVSYMKAAHGGTLFGEAKEISKSSKLATYSMEIKDQQGEMIAVMIGTVYRTRETIPI